MKYTHLKRIVKTHLTPGAVQSNVKQISIESAGGVYSVVRGWKEWMCGAVCNNVTTLVGGAAVAIGVASLLGGRSGAACSLAMCALGGVGCAYAVASAECTPSEVYETLVAEVAQVDALVQVDGRALQKLGSHFRVQTIQDWVHKVQLRFGSLQDTPADRRAARLWLSDELSQSDMRNSDSVLLIPVVLELCFIPNRGDIVAKGIRDTKVSMILKDMCPRPSN